MPLQTVELVTLSTKVHIAPSQLEERKRYHACLSVLPQGFASAALITSLMATGATGAALEVIRAQAQ